MASTLTAQVTRVTWVITRLSSVYPLITHSQVAFPQGNDYNGGVCPQSHPKAIYSVFYEFFYDTAPYPDYQNWVYAMGDPTGYGLHADFINGWTNQNALAAAVTTCTGPGGFNSPSCSVEVRVSHSS